MIFCSNCGTEITEILKFCPSCGDSPTSGEKDTIDHKQAKKDRYRDLRTRLEKCKYRFHWQICEKLLLSLFL